MTVIEGQLALAPHHSLRSWRVKHPFYGRVAGARLADG